MNLLSSACNQWLATAKTLREHSRDHCQELQIGLVQMISCHEMTEVSLPRTVTKQMYFRKDTL
jgi:hypothetical protein